MNGISDREAIGELRNTLGLDCVEFIEYATTRPQAFGQLLEKLGFHLAGRHRSREVLLYRQGGMNIIVNAHTQEGLSTAYPSAMPEIAAIAFRVRDAGAAWRAATARGAWPVAPQVEAMELNIPAIRGVGASKIYFVDRYEEFSIYDVDFVPVDVPAARRPLATPLRFFGIVQYVGIGRLDDWIAFYENLLDFSALPPGTRFGNLPSGRVLQSPCHRFFLQLIEPTPDAASAHPVEQLHRLAFATPDVLASVEQMRRNGLDFVESSLLHSDDRGALTQAYLDGVHFELVRELDDAPGAAS
ncbi:4-hydroxyphenylpyruvate dioxygenase [Kerstersia sp.]|uniref:4-hydroxyphenylpyruvate dioxygenase n=1 Tax=Kerstersia sp. TaxID=1930783 RepID=UPI003F91814C